MKGQPGYIQMPWRQNLLDFMLDNLLEKLHVLFW